MNRKILFLVFLLLHLSLTSVFALTKKDVQTMIEHHQYEQAAVALRSMISQPAFARDADCNKWLGQSLCMTGRFAESQPYLEFAVKQNKKSGAQWYLAITLQHLYDFEGALDALDTYRPVLHSDFWLARADSLEAEIDQCMHAMEHVQDVVIIDSLLVPRASFFTHYRLGAESGRIMSGQDGLFFENQAADYRIYAINDELYQSHKIQGEWQDNELLPGIGSEEFRILDPFLRSDGETLYFACDSTPGLGGLDIYKTKYNSDEGAFYEPERLGMPFNSPFDDYMFAIDETHQIGWWATERNQDPENVIVYLFLVEDAPDYLQEADASRARIDNIAETWREEDGYAELLSSIMNAEQIKTDKVLCHILIADNKVYTDESQFVSKEALAAYRQSIELSERLDEIRLALKALRSDFASAGTAQRRQLKGQILQLENEQLTLCEQLRSAEKMFKRLEQE